MQTGNLSTADWFNAVDVPLLILKRDGYIVRANQHSDRFTGYPATTLQGHFIDFLLPDHQQHHFRQALKTLTRQNPAYQHDCVWLCADGSELSASFSLQLLPESDQIVCTIKPATGKYHRLYQQMFETSQAIKLIIDPETGAIVDASDAAISFYGYSRQELRQMTIKEINMLTQEEVHAVMQQTVARGQQVLEFQHRLKDGSIRDVDVLTSRIVLDGRDMLYSIITDATGKRKAERQLRDSEIRYRRITETLQQGVSVEDENGRFVYVNDVLTEMLGYHRSELIGKRALDITVPDSHAIVQKQNESRTEGSSSRYEAVLQRRDGTPVYVIIAGTPIVSDEGDYRGSFAIVTDISERKDIEEALRRSNQELNEFTHIVAHDLKNPLSNLISYADLLENTYPMLSDDEKMTIFKQIGYTADKMFSIVDELLLLSQMRHKDVAGEPLDMLAILNEALQSLRYMTLQYDATIDIQSPETWTTARGYAGWIEAVWVNYISNAIKYGGDSPRIEIFSVTREDGVHFCVRDYGRGIPKNQQSRLFVSFERLEEKRIEGHGVGLSIVRRIMEKLNGRAGVRSQPGEGSIFYFVLPPVAVPAET